ncbi:CU044_5270 family protein [Streptomyces sp. MS19]|uniref:CU044_5270 family protein n=1 Tax=Streptomyces sp. MS19 TaxID=3385972 RepID=UPI0039A3BD45
MSEIEREQERAAEPAAVPARPKRRRALWVALPVAAALVAGAVTYTARDGDGAGDVIGTPMAASPAQFLRQVSVRAGELPVPRADQFIYQRTVSTFRPMTEEEWAEYYEENGTVVAEATEDGGWMVRTDGPGITHPPLRVLWTDLGRPMGRPAEPYETENWISTNGTTGWSIDPYDPVNTEGDGAPVEVEIPEPYLEAATYEYLTELPTDAGALRDLVYHEFGEEDGMTGEALEQRVFNGIGSLAYQELLPPGLAAGLYEALGQVPGVAMLEGIEDAAGRTTVGVGRLDQDTGVRCTYLFDPETYDLLGYQEVQVEEQDGVAVGTLLDNQAILERGVVDELRQRPGEGSGAA